MAHYAIGDIQGCYQSLQALIAKIEFDPTVDRLWLTGDLVNRGPANVEVLRWARELGDRCVAVLGNHDLHLIACARGDAQPRRADTFGDVLAAEDGSELVDWLATRPFLHREGELVLVHAGFHPMWTDEMAMELAEEAAVLLRSDRAGSFANRCRQPAHAHWSPMLSGLDRSAAAAAILVRIRCCSADGTLSDYTGPPESAPEGMRPWYEYRWPSRNRVLFGHWSALGYRAGRRYIGLDSGCVWGGELTALRLDDMRVFTQPAVE